MGIFREIPPTAGFTVSPKELLSSLFNKGEGSLEEDFKSYLNVPYAATTYSGTAAFYIILEGLKQLSPKKTVIIPTFICPLVPLAIKRAGLNIRVCDINRDNFGFDITRLEKLCRDSQDILAIVAVHLAGIPVDFEPIKQIAENQKCFVIEDCAQSLGAEYKGKKTGTLGDFSFFSLCRGKGLTIYEGGLIVTKNNQYAGLLDKQLSVLAKNDLLSEGLKILELAGYSIFYRPRLFWFVFRLPQDFWSWRRNPVKALGDYFTSDFALHKVSTIRKSLGHISFGRLGQEIDKQRQKALFYLEALNGMPGIKIIRESPADRATYPYLTLVLSSLGKRDKTLKTLIGSGLGASQIYMSAITDYEYLKSMIKDSDSPNARDLAEKHLTLSTNSFLTNKDASSIIKGLKRL